MDQRKDNRHQESMEEEGNNGEPYSFLKFHVVEDDNATEEESLEGYGVHKMMAAVSRSNAVNEDNHITMKYSDGFQRRKNSQNSQFSRGSGNNPKRASIKNASMLNNYFPTSGPQTQGTYPGV